MNGVLVSTHACLPKESVATKGGAHRLRTRKRCLSRPTAYRDNGKENGNYYIIIGYIIYWCYIGMMEKKIETTI